MTTDFSRAAARSQLSMRGDVLAKVLGGGGIALLVGTRARDQSRGGGSHGLGTQSACATVDHKTFAMPRGCQCAKTQALRRELGVSAEEGNGFA